MLTKRQTVNSELKFPYSRFMDQKGNLHYGFIVAVRTCSEHFRHKLVHAGSVEQPLYDDKILKRPSRGVFCIVIKM